MTFAEYSIFCDTFDDLGDVVAKYLADSIFCPHKFHTAFLLSMIRNYFSVHFDVSRWSHVDAVLDKIASI